METLNLFINGELVPAVSGKTREIECPADQEVHTHASDAGTEDVAAAIASARAEFDSGEWPRKTVGERADILRRIADRLVADKAEIARHESLDAGKTFAESEGRR